MLVEFSVENYRSFDSRQTLSMVPGRERTHPENRITIGGIELLKSAALYGANASGKSNLVRAMSYFTELVREPARRKSIGDPIRFDPFRLRRGAEEEPSKFEAVVLADGVRCAYGFSATTRVHDEWLTVYPKGRPQRWLERKLDPATGETEWRFRGPLARHGRLLGGHTRENGLALSRAVEMNIGDVFPLYDTLIGAAQYSPGTYLSVERFSRWLRKALEPDELLETINSLLRETEPHIRDLAFVNEESETELPRFFESEETGTGTIRSTAKWPVLMSRHAADDGSEVMFPFHEAESMGTRRFVELLGPALEALKSGSPLIVDELESSLHPLLARKLVELFHSPKWNPRGAQLIFTTHDVTLMDQSLFRRDQIYLVEKGADQASRLVSLFDFDEKPRKGEALARRYLAGRYGGIPVFGPELEDLP